MNTLAMLKMEKNFIALLEKGYPRNPYHVFTCGFLFARLEDELEELKFALERQDVENAMEECADLSNLIDYLFERLSRIPASTG